jgi:hypothetical protein
LATTADNPADELGPISAAAADVVTAPRARSTSVTTGLKAADTG